MGRLSEEVREWNSPVVGAYVFWRFTRSFVENHPHSDAPVVILHFIASPMLTFSDFNFLITARRPNLASYVKGFSEPENRKSDVLASLSQRISKQREYSMKAIDIAVATGLLAWEIETAKLYPFEKLTIMRGTATKGISVQAIGNKADVLGKWFANLDVPTIMSSLGVIL